MSPEIEDQIREEIAKLKELLMLKTNSMEQLTEEKFAGAADALRIQAKEYERRLDALNGEAARLREIQSTYLPKEIYEAKQKEQDGKIDNLIFVNQKSEGKSEGISMTVAAIFGVTVLLISIAGLIISLVR